MCNSKGVKDLNGTEVFSGVQQIVWLLLLWGLPSINRHQGGLEIPWFGDKPGQTTAGKERGFQEGMLRHFKRKILVKQSSERQNKPHWHLLPMGLVWSNKGKVQTPAHIGLYELNILPHNTEASTSPPNTENPSSPPHHNNNSWAKGEKLAEGWSMWTRR